METKKSTWFCSSCFKVYKTNYKNKHLLTKFHKENEQLWNRDVEEIMNDKKFAKSKLAQMEKTLNPEEFETFNMIMKDIAQDLVETFDES